MTLRQISELESFAKYCMEEGRDFNSFYETAHSDDCELSRDEAYHHWEMVK